MGILSDTGTLDYTPPPTVAAYMEDPSLAKFIVGPLGSAKTFGNVMHLFWNTISQPPDHNGIRWTRHAVTRNTLVSLRQTCLEDIRAILEPIAVWKVSESTVHINMPLGDGTIAVSKWLLLPLDNPEDQKRLLSQQLHSAWASEFRELPYQIMAALIGRLGRFPSKIRGAMAEGYNLLAESNPFPEGSDWHDNLVINLPDDWAFYHQPGGLDPGAENIENLPPGYYRRIMQGQAQDWIDVHVHAKFGDDPSGQTVFRHSFSYERHTKSGLKYNPETQLLIGQDFGRTPTSLLAQIDHMGRLLILREITSQDMGIITFTNELLKPMVREQFGAWDTLTIADPAGKHPNDVSDFTPFQVLRDGGFKTMAASTNLFHARKGAVENMLMQTRMDGEPALLIDRDGCPNLIKALRSSYRYKRMTSGELQPEPLKTHPWSDLADCLQYLCLHAADAGPSGRLARRAAALGNIRQVRVSGWT